MCHSLSALVLLPLDSEITSELTTTKMAESASASNQPCHARSFSLPSTSHPLALRMEQELRHLRSSVDSESSAPQKVCDGLRQLGSLYESVKELICLTSCQRNLIDALQKKWVEDELDESIRLLDLCSALKDSLGTMKDHIQAIRLALRRQNSMVILNKLNDYVRDGRKTEKEIKNFFRCQKEMEDKFIDSNEVSSATFRMMIEVKMATISQLQLVSSFFTRQTRRPKSIKWASFSRVLRKRKVAAEEQSEDIFSLFSSFSCFSPKDLEAERVLKTKGQLQMIEVSIEGLENGLDCLFRQLIQLRVALLNLLNP